MTANAAVAMLMKEHEVILEVIESLRKISDFLRMERPVEPALLRKAVEFLREYADKFHHAKEEDLLFPAFIKHGVPPEGCPIAALLHEHKKGRELVGRLDNALVNYGAGKPGANEEVAAAIDAIVKLYPNHIWKEDAMVFPMAEKLLPADAGAQLHAQFQSIEAGQPVDAHEQFAQGIAAEVAGMSR